MKTATWIIITLTLIIILGLLYYYYCVCQKDTKEGFSVQSSANSAYSERPLLWLTPDDTYKEIGLDAQGGKLLIIDPLGENKTKKFMLIKPKSVSYTKLAAPTNLYVNKAGDFTKDYEAVDPNSFVTTNEFWEEVTGIPLDTDGTNTNTPTSTSTTVWRKYKVNGFEDGDPILEKDKDESTNPHANVGSNTSDPISFIWYTTSDGKAVAGADEDIHSLIYSSKPLYDFDEALLNEDILKQSSLEKKPTGWWCCAKDDKKVLISQISTEGSMHWSDYAQVTLSDSFPVAKANTLDEYSKANYGDSSLQRALFSATIDNEGYNKNAALEPIIDTVFFDPLNYNFVHLEHVNGKINTIVYDIGGNPSTYVNEPYSGDLKSVKPWAIVCNKNGVILYINPKDNATPANRLRISIFSPKSLPGEMSTRSVFTLSHTSNVFILDSSVDSHKDPISRIKEDRSNGIAKQALLYFKDENIAIDKVEELRELLKGGSIEINGKKEDVPMGSFSCIKDELKYFQFGSHPDDVSRCVIGDYKEYLEDEAKKKEAGDAGTAAGGVVPDGGKTEGYKINVTDVPKEHLDDYYKWMWYWKSKKYEEHNGLRDMSDYILKSSVVPPVCPTCPSCPNTGVCTECGGKGGSGTQGTSEGNAKATPQDSDGDGVIDDVFGGINKVVSGTIDTAGNAASQITDAAGNVVTKVGEQVGSAASALGEGGKSAIGQAYSGGKQAVGDAYGAGKSAVGDVYNAGKRTVGDIYQETKNVGGDAADTAGDAADATGIPEYLGGEMDNLQIAQDNRRKRLEMEGQSIQQQAYSQQFGGSYGRPMPGSITSGTSPNMVYGGSNMGSGVNTYVGVGGQQRVVNPTVSNMNYMGRLPAKGNDKYIPITSDFSSFGR